MRGIEPHTYITAIITLILAFAVSNGAITFKPSRVPNKSEKADYRAVVEKVHDGDTLTVITNDKKKQKIRIWGIDCPELYQSYGQIARYRVRDLLMGKEILISVKDKDRYGRVVAQVTFADGKDLGTYLVKEGLAWWYQTHAKDAVVLEKAEKNARTHKQGLWARHDPVAPWEWRASH
jgi:micrococcal nuclease